MPTIINSDEVAIITIINVLTSSFSLLGSFFMILMFSFFSNLRISAFRLVLFLSISNLFKNIGHLLITDTSDVSHTDGLCIFQAFLLNFSDLTVITWNSVIAWNSYLTVQSISKVSQFKTELFAIILPLLASLMYIII